MTGGEEKTPRTKKEGPLSNRYQIQNKKGFSKEKRPPISVQKARLSQR